MDEISTVEQAVLMKIKGEKMMKKNYVVVTTDKKGVFFGELVEHDKKNETCILKNAKMCIYWPKDVGGVIGLANTGPISDSIITPKCPEIYLNGLTAVMKCTNQAKENWTK